MIYSESSNKIVPTMGRTEGLMDKQLNELTNKWTENLFIEFGASFKIIKIWQQGLVMSKRVKAFSLR